MTRGDHPVVQQLEEQLAQIRERIERKERRGGGWRLVFGGLSLGALAGSALAYYLRSRDEESPLLPSSPPAPLRRDDAIVLNAAPATAAPPASADDDQPIELKTAATPTADPPATAELGTAAPVTAEEALADVEGAPAEGARANASASGVVMPATAARTAPAAKQGASPTAEGATEADETVPTPEDEPIESVEFAGMTVASAPVVGQYEGALPPTDDQCPASHPIKGNLSRSGELIFHVPGSNNYDRTKPEACFATEDDAEAAGFRKARS